MEKIVFEQQEAAAVRSHAAAENFIFYANAQVVNFVFENLNYHSLHAATVARIKEVTANPSATREYYIDLKPLFPVTRLSRQFADINEHLKTGGYYVGCFEDYDNRKSWLFAHYEGLPAFLQIARDYVFRNLFPHWNPGYFLTRYLGLPRRSSISLAEALGRMVNAGFEILNYQSVGYKTYFVARKKHGPKTLGKGSAGIITRLQRIGKGGKIINVYKVRSMYPFSEYLHDYVVNMNGYNKVGKPENDFRLTAFGKFIRKCWIDEIPQLINLIRGDISLVGVRPISVFGFNALPADLRESRVKFKPGLIPPHIALRYKGFDGVIRAEKKYLADKEKYGLRCDIRYFFRALVNILSLRAHSA